MIRGLGLALMISFSSGCQHAAAPAPSGPYGLDFATVPAQFRHLIAAARVGSADLDKERKLPCALSINPKLNPEAFEIRVVRERVSLVAGSEKGLVWGLQQLRQMAREGDRRPVSDQPAWGFRAVSLDVARRYHSPETLRKLIQCASLARVPYINLHLTDDQSWMFPSRVVPTAPLFNRTKKPAYTRAELRELDDFARALGVTLIPEIDVPGHSAILVKVARQWRFPGTWNCIDFRSSWVRGKVKEIFNEAMELFPHSPYIHIGGDEAMYPGGAANEAAFVDFLGETTDHILKRGRTPLVWEGFGRSEFAKKRISKKVVVISWSMDFYRPDHLLADGFKVINACWDPCYVVGHYPWDAFTLTPLPKLFAINPRRFGRMSNESRTLDSKRGISGSMLCWWEGKEEDALRVLPERILAFGARLWKPKLTETYSAFATRTGPELERLLAGRPGFVAPSVRTSTADDPHFSADRLVDGDATTVGQHWIAYPLPASATIDYGRVRTASRVRVVPFFAAGKSTQYRVEVSLDGKAWDRVGLGGGTPTAAGFVHEFASRQVRFVRLTVLSSDQHPPFVGRVHEVELR